MEWLEDNKIPLGKAVQHFIEWLTDGFYWVFDALSAALEAVIHMLLWLLQAPHPVNRH
ncbi:hypothetical protein [Aliiroseovarius crassostreae]|uniref:hypothetical protein n=1 Tax=Aliiroseovarius crassostreae TaxID=154981 RepID=UPI003C7AE99C